MEIALLRTLAEALSRVFLERWHDADTQPRDNVPLAGVI